MVKMFDAMNKDVINVNKDLRFVLSFRLFNTLSMQQLNLSWSVFKSSLYQLIKND